MDDPRTELASLAAALRAQLEAELELKGPGLPSWEAPQPAKIRVEPTQIAEVAAVAPAGTSPADKAHRLAQLAAEAAVCTACVLHERRTKSVFARGNPEAQLVFVGEGPGYEEDIQGLPFVGPAGQLLDRM